MTNVISVVFKKGGKAYYFDPAGVDVVEGDKVIVEMQSGKDMGTVTEAVHPVEDDKIVSPLRKAVRKATEKDIKREEENRAKEPQALKICKKFAEQNGLDMKVVAAEYSFDGSRIVFFFTADGRVDFRGLVKDLATHFHARIEMRQIGVRDEAKMLGGIGSCGQPYCCSRFFNDFQSVSIKMAKIQGLSLNPTKVSGSCGRLMCCLKFEQNAYEYLDTITPRAGSVVKTRDGVVGYVMDANMISGNLLVRLSPDLDAIPQKLHRSEVQVIPKEKKGKESSKKGKGKG